MGTLAIYLNRQYLKFLGICHLIFVSLYFIIHFFERVDNFAESKVAAGKMAVFFIFQIPLIAVQMLPPAALIALIITFSLMERDNEIVALKACGVSVAGLCRPVLATSLGLAAILFILSEFVVPFASSLSNRIWRVEVMKQGPQQVQTRNHIWFKGAECIYYIPYFDNNKKLMLDPCLYFLDSSFTLIKKIDARKALWKGDHWEMTDGISLEAGHSGEYGLTRFERLNLFLPEPPETFILEKRKPEEMNLWELKAFARAMMEEGYDANRYLVDLNIKLAFPFVLVILALLAPTIALWKRRFSTPLAVSIGAAVCFLYLLVLGIARSVGIAGLLPPMLSAWIANGIFFLIGIYLLMAKNR
ncbi:MAG: YjgP/YjgQ family permease [Desulfobacteraceae bacterium]|jgi:lipopolysaccharide export system permease protein|nr:MAG: YjgP/YjgQ family permease [Desulfobacteraceae bacterium]